jgi:hypothetical protein
VYLVNSDNRIKMVPFPYHDVGQYSLFSSVSDIVSSYTYQMSGHLTGWACRK